MREYKKGDSVLILSDDGAGPGCGRTKGLKGFLIDKKHYWYIKVDGFSNPFCYRDEQFKLIKLKLKSEVDYLDAFQENFKYD